MSETLKAVVESWIEAALNPPHPIPDSEYWRNQIAGWEYIQDLVHRATLAEDQEPVGWLPVDYSLGFDGEGWSMVLAKQGFDTDIAVFLHPPTPSEDQKPVGYGAKRFVEEFLDERHPTLTIYKTEAELSGGGWPLYLRPLQAQESVPRIVAEFGDGKVAVTSIKENEPPYRLGLWIQPVEEAHPIGERDPSKQEGKADFQSGDSVMWFANPESLKVVMETLSDGAEIFGWTLAPPTPSETETREPDSWRVINVTDATWEHPYPGDHCSQKDAKDEADDLFKDDHEAWEEGWKGEEGAAEMEPKRTDYQAVPVWIGSAPVSEAEEPVCYTKKDLLLKLHNLGAEMLVVWPETGPGLIALYAAPPKAEEGGEREATLCEACWSEAHESTEHSTDEAGLEAYNRLVRTCPHAPPRDSAVRVERAGELLGALHYYTHAKDPSYKKAFFARKVEDFLVKHRIADAILQEGKE